MPGRPPTEGLEWAVNGGRDTGPACSRLWARARADTHRPIGAHVPVTGRTRGRRAPVFGTVAPVMERRTGPAGRSRLRLIHANDSRDGCGSHRDRHENFGAGQIGTAPFAALLRHPATRGVPFVVETPGPRAAAAADIATLKALRGQGQAVRAPAGAMR